MAKLSDTGGGGGSGSGGDQSSSAAQRRRRLNRRRARRQAPDRDRNGGGGGGTDSTSSDPFENAQHGSDTYRPPRDTDGNGGNGGTTDSASSEPFENAQHGSDTYRPPDARDFEGDPYTGAQHGSGVFPAGGRPQDATPVAVGTVDGTRVYFQGREELPSDTARTERAVDAAQDAAADEYGGLSAGDFNLVFGSDVTEFRRAGFTESGRQQAGSFIQERARDRARNLPTQRDGGRNASERVSDQLAFFENTRDSAVRAEAADADTGSAGRFQHDATGGRPASGELTPHDVSMGIAGGLDTAAGRRRTASAIREHATDPAENLHDQYTPFKDLAATSAEQVTPHALMAIGDDQAALDARAEKEDQFAADAEAGADAIASGDLPSLGEASGLLFQAGEVTERGLLNVGRGAVEHSPTAGRGPTLPGGIRAGDVPGYTAEGLIGGVAIGAGSFLQYVPSGGRDAGAQTQSPVVVGDQGVQVRTPFTDAPTPTKEAGGFEDVFANVGQRQVETVKDRPYSSAILLGLPAVEAVPAGLRGVRATRGTQGTVKFGEMTSTKGAQGELPNFRTNRGEPTSRAVTEIEARARSSPESVKQTTGTDQVLYHSTEATLGPEFTAAKGRSELPGLFTSPDASPLRLSEGAQASVRQRLRPGRPDMSTSPDRIAAFEGNRIEGMPDTATGSGRVRDPSGDGWIPDPSTSGARFLTEQADAGTAYVRPPGSRTTELEAIFPPGSQFGQTGKFAAELPSGQKVPLDVFRRSGESAAAPSSAPRSAGELSRQYSSQPTGRTGFTDITYGSALGGASSLLPSRGFPGSSPPATSTPSQPSGFDTGIPSEPPTSAPTGPPTATRAPSQPSGFDTGIPSEPPSSTPSGPGSSAPGRPFGPLTGSPPSSPPRRLPRGRGKKDDAHVPFGRISESRRFEEELVDPLVGAQVAAGGSNTDGPALESLSFF